MRAVIFANGVIENIERALEAVENADLIVAADGGARHCLRLGVMPEVVLGDLDSLIETDQRELEANGAELIRHPEEKDQTDLELALLFTVSRKASEITVLGAMGGRLDMTLANLLLLSMPELSAVRVEVWHADQTAWVVRPPGESIRGEPGEVLSLIPMGGEVDGVESQDLQYALSDETLIAGPARGVSNVISGPAPEVRFTSGALLLVHTKGTD